MPDITVTYEGNTIATMSASGTKTFYTAGKYCDDDITLTYVQPGGGSSNISGSFTPAENALTFTISALAGATQEHFFIKASGLGSSVLGHGVRVVGPGFIEYTTGSENFYCSGSNSGGSSMASYAAGLTAGSSDFGLNRTTGVFTTSTASGSGYILGGITYDWWMW